MRPKGQKADLFVPSDPPMTHDLPKVLKFDADMKTEFCPKKSCLRFGDRNPCGLLTRNSSAASKRKKCSLHSIFCECFCFGPRLSRWGPVRSDTTARLLLSPFTGRGRSPSAHLWAPVSPPIMGADCAWRRSSFSKAAGANDYVQ
jgi:hypothetical protein